MDCLSQPDAPAVRASGPAVQSAIVVSDAHLRADCCLLRRVLLFNQPQGPSSSPALVYY